MKFGTEFALDYGIIDKIWGVVLQFWVLQSILIFVAMSSLTSAQQ